LHVLQGVALGSGGVLDVENSSLRADLGSKTSFIIDGTLLFQNGGQITLGRETELLVGNVSTGQMMASGGTVAATTVRVGNTSGSQGTLTISSSAAFRCSSLSIGQSANATGAVWVTGGELTTTNYGQPNVIYVGNSGSGQMTVSNGMVRTSLVYVGAGMGYFGGISPGVGTFTVAGGKVVAGGNPTTGNVLNIGYGPRTTGVVSLAGGLLVVTNGNTIIGRSGFGQLTANGGNMLASSITVGQFSGSQGLLTVSGGTVSVWSSLLVSDCATTASGQLTVVSGGSLFVTNASHTAFLDVRHGTVIVGSGGILRVDKLVMTNACGVLLRSGGTLAYSNLVIDPNLSAVSDGIPNGWKQQFGLDPFDTTLAAADRDGDGMSNLQEYLAGTDPTNSASAFRITEIAPESNDLRVSWATAGGRTNVLQARSSSLGVFYNISTNIVLPGVGDVVTNWLDTGATTNAATRFYRATVRSLSVSDTNAPSLTITSPIDNLLITNSSITVAGTSADTSGVAGVEVQGIAASSGNGYSNWTAVVSGLADGTNTLIALAGDNSAPANIATGTVHVICATGSYDGNGDGLPDGWQIQYFGSENSADAVPSADSDGDGMSNLQEYLVGTDPTSNASAFRILSVVATNNDIVVTWATAGGRTNVVQSASDLAGSYANVSLEIVITGTGDTTTNWLEAGRATNIFSRYYRIRLVP
jgi:T5SS/PEP-CTERM-associated repeat protein